jgi:hypothetical protein
MKAKKLKLIDSVRASRDGHEFHETWAARKALQLLLPTDNLVGIAIEGLSPVDQASAPSETVEIADLTIYYGGYCSFKLCRRAVIQQFKYSVSRAQKEFRGSDARKTVRKFAKTFRNHKKQYGEKAVKKKLEFEIVTNRPISSAFSEAVICIASGKKTNGPVKDQVTQFKSACGLAQADLVEFAKRLTITGLAGSLRNNKGSLSRTLVDWSASSDTIAGTLLFGLVQLVRDKAGSAGEGKNVIRRTDVLGALNLQSEDQLLPCPASFPNVGPVVPREQLGNVLSKISKSTKPLLVHAAGGVGKTVFLQSVYQALSKSHHCVIFDCFGGGAYRSPSDQRHLPRRGLVHLVNSLACDGLCDPLLPMNSNVEDLLKTAYSRFKETAATLRRASKKRQLLVFIDAIDNAAEYAKERHEKGFPTLLLEEFHYKGQIPGVKFVVSSRTHRREDARDLADCEEFELKSFSLPETRKYLQTHVKEVTETEIQVAHARSEGNPRILEHLATSDRGLLDKSQMQEIVKLDDLLEQRLKGALQVAVAQGYKDVEIREFLAGLSALPPPVPLDEYAKIQRLELSAIESFATDLAPLLERTKHGVIFRDEPTETLIREKYASDLELLRNIAKNLFDKQDSSVYAAESLPRLLQKLDDGTSLLKLAFDERFPDSIKSLVGRQAIRYARLKAATMHVARNRDYNNLVSLLVELSTIAAINQRGTDFILQNPDLTVVFKDASAVRRLFEARTAWPGARFARQAIVHALLAEFNDSLRNAIAVADWIAHYRQQEASKQHNEVQPGNLDMAAVPLSLIVNNRSRNAINVLSGWKDWYVYELCSLIFPLLHQAQSVDGSIDSFVSDFINSLKSEIGALTGVLSFGEPRTTQRRVLINKLAQACKKRKVVEIPVGYWAERRNTIGDGLLKAATIALSLKMRRQAALIVEGVAESRPRLSEFDRFYSDHSVEGIFAFACRTVISAAARNEEINERSMLPIEVMGICSALTLNLTGKEFRAAAKKELEERWQKEIQQKNNRTLTHDGKAAIDQFIDVRLDKLQRIFQLLSDLIRAPYGKVNEPFTALVKMWSTLRSNVDSYEDRRRATSLYRHLVQKLVIFALGARDDLDRDSAEAVVDELKKGEELTKSALIAIVSLFSRKSDHHDLAGVVAIKARAAIEREDDIEVRASSYADLARAMLRASAEEASTYFQAGLEQMDAIGSSDYSFTNELLLFAAAMKGGELEEKDFHTLTNICELNLPSEEEKFVWSAFGHCMSKISGCRGLAKLARWADRSKVSLDCSLLPYIIALIDDGKIEPENAVALLRLTKPWELWWSDSGTLVDAIHRRNFDNERSLISEIMKQYRDNNPGYFSSSLWETLGPIAVKLYGEDAEETKLWAQLSSRYSQLREERNTPVNPRYEDTKGSSDQNKSESKQIKQLASKTSATNVSSMSRAIESLKGARSMGGSLEPQLLAAMRKRVQFSDRVRYTEVISQITNLSLYAKLEELRTCRELWQDSVASLDGKYKDIGLSLLRTHTDELILNSYLGNYALTKISELTRVSIANLVIELIKIFSEPEIHIPASVWMGLGVVACKEAKEGVGQVALKRLLNSGATKLTSSVADGAWQSGLYPSGDENDIIAGLVWSRLGAPSASDRWRAAHSIRYFAKFERWEVIDRLVSKLQSAKEATPFQARELKFYYLHARLWLLIALGRVALDKPKEITRYASALLDIALNKEFPHLLLRYFAADVLIRCEQQGETCMNDGERLSVRRILNPIRISKKTNPSPGYSGKSDESDENFYLDYDFEKYNVSNLAEVFGRAVSETKQLIGRWARKLDSSAKSMYDAGGRSDKSQRFAYGMSPSWHGYGQQLGWHSLHLVAGGYLASYPVFKHRYREDAWSDWLKSRLLTRGDGLWLADGIDYWPLKLQVHLLENMEQKLSITGDEQKLLNLIGIDGTVLNELVVAGHWRSQDDIEVHIYSALVEQQKSESLAQQIVGETPYFSFLPYWESGPDGNEFDTNRRREDFSGWITLPSIEGGLDEYDQLGAEGANERPRFSNDIIADFCLQPVDPFNRRWVKSSSVPVAYAEAWLQGSRNDDDGRSAAERLVVTGAFLREVLNSRRAELLVLIKLQRYKSNSRAAGTFSNTTAVVRINENLSIHYLQGVINKQHKMES